jgi:Tuberculosis necrotizing toxin
VAIGELVFPEHEPRVLTEEDEQRSRQRTAELIREAMERAEQAASTTGRYAAPDRLEPGLIVDHFGQESGSLLYADRTPFEQRSQPPSALNAIDPATIRWLLRAGYLRRVATGQGAVQAAAPTAPQRAPAGPAER